MTTEIELMSISIGRGGISLSGGRGGYTWVPSFLLRDDLTGDLAAGAVDDTAATPGPGTRDVVDSEAKQAVGGGKLIVAGGKATPAYGDPGVSWSPVILRAAGAALYWRWHPTTLAGKIVTGGFHTAQGVAEQPIYHFMLNSTASVNIYDAVTQPAVDSGVAADAIDERILLMRSSGMYFFGRKAGQWILQWIGQTGSANLYPMISNYNASLEVDDVRVVNILWLPAPIVSHGFAGVVTSDGLGHAEQTGIGAGGSSVAMTQRAGTWGAANNVASASALDDGVAIATYPATADVWVQVGLAAYTANNVGIILRWTDANNYVRVYYDGTNVVIEEIVAGTGNVLATTAATYVANGILRAFVDGTTIRAFFAGFARGTGTLNAALTGTVVGFFTTDTGNTFRNFLAYTRGTQGEYGHLNVLRTGDEANLFAVGDSKTSTQTWVTTLRDSLNASATPMHREVIPRPAAGGLSVATMQAAIDGYLTNAVGTAHIALINLGANDVGALPAEATWKANLTYIVDAIRTKWPDINVYIARPWRRDYDAECDTLATWIADVVATYGSGVAVGMDERIWMKGGDDGATMTTDGIHYSTAGQTAAAAAWADVLNP